jgi:cobalt-zinc-cadmium resistance protein CzcA
MYLKRSLLILSIRLLFIPTSAFSQIPISNEKVVEQAIQNYPQLKAANQSVEQQSLLKPAGFNLANPELLLQAPTGDQMRLGVMQRIDFPTLYVQQIKLQKEASEIAKSQRDVSINQVKYLVQSTYIEFQYWYETQLVLKRFDSLLSDIVQINEVRYRVGQISNLEKINGEAKYKTLQFTILQADAELMRARKQLLIYMGILNDSNIVPDGKLKKYDPLITLENDSAVFTSNPYTHYLKNQIDYSTRLHKVERNKAYPGIVVGYLNQAAPDTKTQYRLQYGLTVPIWFWQYNARIKAAKKGIEIAETQYQLGSYQLNSEYYQAQARYKQYAEGLRYYEQTGLLQAAETLKSAGTSYRLGSIGYYAYLMNIEQAFQLERNYIEALKNYNQSILYIHYIKGDI